jgi:hypothetical protein
MFLLTNLKIPESKEYSNVLQIYLKNLRAVSHEKRAHKISGQNAL